LSVCRRTPLSEGLLSTRDAFKDGHPLLHELISLNVQEICAWKSMLGDEDGLLVPLDVSEEFGGLSLERCDEFGAHGVTLEYHSKLRKCSAKDPTHALSGTGLRRR